MMHRVAAGDCLSSIADRYGLFWETIWNDAQNAELKSRRLDPNVLLPGDQVYIPVKRIKNETAATEKSHLFRMRGVPVRLRIQFLGQSGPRRGVPYTLTIEGRVVSEAGAKTDANGFVIARISPQAKTGQLVLGEAAERVEYTLQLGHINPVSAISGQKQRLQNLGFFDASIDEEETEAWSDALAAFQSENKLPADGKPDAATREKLRLAHDGL